MISYDRMWSFLKKKGISQYTLINEYHFSTGQLDRLRKNNNVSSHTINKLCKILDCRIEDIAEYIEDPEETL